MLIDRFPGISVLHVNDLVKRFGYEIKQIDMPGDVEFLPGDIEKIRLPQQYQLILSSSTFHWLHDLSIFFDKLKRHLLPGGILAFTIYGPKNLQEVRSVTGTGLTYLSLEQVVNLLERNFEVLVAEEHVETFIFSNPYEVLKHFRQTGINALTQGGWSRGRLKNFVDKYHRQFRRKNGVCLTYHPMYFLARPLPGKTD
jgi:malonyl-ACP O-methyltransferase BioC